MFLAVRLCFWCCFHNRLSKSSIIILILVHHIFIFLNSQPPLLLSGNDGCVVSHVCRLLLVVFVIFGLGCRVHYFFERVVLMLSASLHLPLLLPPRPLSAITEQRG